jgi:steroid delta-isomerase-like uncharacterized protein
MSEKKVMTPKEVIIAFMSAWNKGDIEGAAATMDPKCTWHYGQSVMTTAQFIEFAKQFMTAFPGNSYTIEDMIEAGNKTAIRYKWTGKNTGSFMGMPPTNKTLTMDILEWDIVKDGKFIESWAMEDTYNFMQQLGIAPG